MNTGNGPCEKKEFGIF